ncbi:hypothetical protein [Brevibacterium otitidis]|uniref:Uncharacterized protein n=1 Tax=Brevibacterium otitidis TaxID=53364 RepID=A0ABV5X138_9MICO
MIVSFQPEGIDDRASRMMQELAVWTVLIGLMRVWWCPPVEYAKDITECGDGLREPCA